MNHDEPTFHVLRRDLYLDALDEAFPRWREVWYYRFFRLIPRGFYKRGRVVILRGYEYNARLVAHEYGHWVGLRHPPVMSLEYWTDVMGYGFRLRDRYGLLAASKEWRKRQGFL